jgi:hypothetical protein
MISGSRLKTVDIKTIHSHIDYKHYLNKYMSLNIAKETNTLHNEMGLDDKGHKLMHYQKNHLLLTKEAKSIT